MTGTISSISWLMIMSVRSSLIWVSSISKSFHDCSSISCTSIFDKRASLTFSDTFIWPAWFDCQPRSLRRASFNRSLCWSTFAYLKVKVFGYLDQGTGGPFNPYGLKLSSASLRPSNIALLWMFWISTVKEMLDGGESVVAESDTDCTRPSLSFSI